LAIILGDEPEWVKKLEIVLMDFGGAGQGGAGLAPLPSKPRAS
jgi:hypothetical protein